jgi:uncharacterized protein (DUF4415 family)
MKQKSTRRTSRIKINEEIHRAYKDRDAQIEKLDPDAPMLPPEAWADATIGRYYRPIKTQITVRIDREILDWLRAKGSGHLTRINEILRERMTAERARRE